MGTELADTGTTSTTPDDRLAGWRAYRDRASAPWDESPGPSLGLRVTEDRVLIQSDQDDHAPTETASGVLLAPTMASAVEGTDTTESWYTGRVVQVGPLVGRRDV